jgi:transposase
MSVLLEQGHSQSAVARLLGVSEGTVRYHRKRMKGAVVDGGSKQVLKAAAFADVIEAWRSQQAGGRLNLALLHDWLRREHGYTGSLKSVQRHWKRTYPAPKIRARRRVETPPGAQAQVDWVEFPGVTLGREEVDLVALIVTLSWSRKRAVVRARGKDMLSWQSCQIGCLQRLGGVPAVLRIDNVKTAIATGDGSWGKINEIYLPPFRDPVAVSRRCLPAPASAGQRKGRTARAGSAPGCRSPEGTFRRPCCAAGGDGQPPRGSVSRTDLPGDRDHHRRGLGTGASSANPDAGRHA